MEKAISLAEFTAAESAWSSQETGLIETVLWENGRFFLQNLHEQRWLNSYKKLFASTTHPQQWFQFVAQFLKNKLAPHRVRFVIFSEKVLVQVDPLTAQPLIATLGIYPTEKIKWNHISGMKTTRREVYNHALQFAAAQGCDDAIILNEHDEIVETAKANLFWKKDKAFYTPPISSGCVAGTYRKHLLCQLKALSGVVYEVPCRVTDLRQADMVYTGNALRKLKICQLNF